MCIRDRFLALALAFVPSLLGLDAELVAKVCRQTYRVLWMDPASLLLTMLLAVWWFERPGSRPSTTNATTEPG